MKALIPGLIGLFAVTVQAATPNEILAGYRAEAAKNNPRYQSSAELGAQLYRHPFGMSAKMPSCSSCHGDDPTRGGSHVVTGKAIQPLAPAANAERFSDPAKVEKWFRRNCGEVLGRECNANEKADFITFVMRGR